MKQIYHHKFLSFCDNYLDKRRYWPDGDRYEGGVNLA
jgi:hypothetical protein